MEEGRGGGCVRLSPAALIYTESARWFHVQEFGTRSCLVPMHIQPIHAETQPKKRGVCPPALVSTSEIKRINPCNMHDESHEYVKGKKKLRTTAGFTVFFFSFYGRFM